MAALCGAKCLQPIDLSEPYVKCCSVFCQVRFHLKCAAISKEAHQSIEKFKTVVFRCMRCSAVDDNVGQAFMKIYKKLEQMDKKNDETNKYIDERLAKLEKTTVDKTAEIINICENDENTWSRVVKGKKNKANPVIVVQPKDKQQKCEVTRKSVESAINPNQFEIRGVKKASSGGIIIECSNDVECEKLQQEVEKKLGNDVVATKPAKRLPKVKILRISHYDKTDEELIGDLKLQNPNIKDDELKVIKREDVVGKSDGCFNVILQVTGKTHKKLMNEQRVRIGWNNCKVVDNVYIMRCYKCLGFSHKAAECKNQQSTCQRCSSTNHEKKDCKAETEKCANCMRTNSVLKLNLDVNHSVWSTECKVYQRKLEISKRSIHYVD